MFVGTTSMKGHNNSSSALKRHGLRVRNKMSSSCSKSLCMIVAISVIILIAISTTVVHLGQDLIYAEKLQKESSQYNEHPLLDHLRKRTQKNDNDDSNSSTSNSNDDSNSSTSNSNESIDDDDDDEDTERMDINGQEVNIKKSELQRVWKQVESELPQSNEQQPSDSDNDNDNEDTDSGNESDNKYRQNKESEDESNDPDAQHAANMFDSEDKQSADIMDSSVQREHDSSHKEAHTKHLESLDSDELERLLYPEYFSLHTFFDIDPNDVEGLIKYWKQPGIPHYKDLSTKFRKIQRPDLKETIMYQDEYHNKKLEYMYDLNSERGHSWNVDYEYVYPFLYPVQAYNEAMLDPRVFHGNVSQFLKNIQDTSVFMDDTRWNIYDIFASNRYKYKRIISKQDMYDKHEEYLRDNYKDIELIFPENDTLLFAMLNTFGERLRAHIVEEEKDHTASNHGGKFLRALKNMEDESSSSTRRKKRRLKEGFGVFNDESSVDLKHIDIDDMGDSTKEDIDRPRMHNFNGLTSDITYFNRNRSSVQYDHNTDMDDAMKVFIAGNLAYNDAMENDKQKRSVYNNNRFWRLHDHCVRRKSTTVYPNWRILYASNPLTCDIILNELLDPISDCLIKEGWNCPLMIDHGYFRFVFKSEAPAKYLYKNPIDPEQIIPIVLKVMKTEFVDFTTDWMRHIREAIFLQQLQRWEHEVIDMFGAQFESLGQKRAFYYVPELGHCLYPTYITVTPYYNVTLKKFVLSGAMDRMTLKEVTQKTLQILSGLQVMHHIEGGPYMHTDLQPRQFMLDDHRNILINDFNRGKFTEYYFKNEVEGRKGDKDVIIPCTYCMPFSHGHFRAPEEYYSDPLMEGLDLWSICLTIWNLFSHEKPWKSLGSNYEAIKYVTHDYQMRPKFPYSIPPYLKDVLRHCWRQNMYDRPDINELITSIHYFFTHIRRLSDGRQHSTLGKLYRIKAFQETNFPNMEKIKEFI